MLQRRALLLLLPGSALAQAAATEPVHVLHIARGELPADQRRIVARQGDQVRLRVTSDGRGDLHLHAYRLSASLGPGSTVELAFTARAAGRFPLTWHPAGADADAPHAQPLAMLEVQPR